MPNKGKVYNAIWRFRIRAGIKHRPYYRNKNRNNHAPSAR